MPNNGGLDVEGRNGSFYIMVTRPTKQQIVEQMLWHLSRAMHEGSAVVTVRGYLVYQTTWLGISCNTPKMRLITLWLR